MDGYAAPSSLSPPHQVQVSESAPEEGELCPVCNESLTSDYRIFGERPHVVGECGHEVHHVSDSFFRPVSLTFVGMFPTLLW